MVPLELWDLELCSGILWDHMEGEGLVDALAEAIARLIDGTARTRSGTPIPAGVGELDAVWLAGGRAAAIDASALQDRIGHPVWVAQDPEAVAHRGARSLVPHHGRLAVVDLGQSRLKVFTAEHQLSRPRDWSTIPMREHVAPDDPRPASALRAWVTETLAEIRADPETVILALPCELGDSPIPCGSSYPGLQGEARFVPDVVAAAGWTPRELRVVNDAELAAAAARLDPRIRGHLTLVLTLGFGVGAALSRP